MLFIYYMPFVANIFSQRHLPPCIPRAKARGFTAVVIRGRTLIVPPLFLLFLCRLTILVRTRPVGIRRNDLAVQLVIGTAQDAVVANLPPSLLDGMLGDADGQHLGIRVPATASRFRAIQGIYGGFVKIPSLILHCFLFFISKYRPLYVVESTTETLQFSHESLVLRLSCSDFMIIFLLRVLEYGFSKSPSKNKITNMLLSAFCTFLSYKPFQNSSNSIAISD